MVIVLLKNTTKTKLEKMGAEREQASYNLAAKRESLYIAIQTKAKASFTTRTTEVVHC